MLRIEISPYHWRPVHLKHRRLNRCSETRLSTDVRFSTYRGSEQSSQDRGQDWVSSPSEFEGLVDKQIRTWSLYQVFSVTHGAMSFNIPQMSYNFMARNATAQTLIIQPLQSR